MGLPHQFACTLGHYEVPVNRDVRRHPCPFTQGSNLGGGISPGMHAGLGVDQVDFT